MNSKVEHPFEQEKRQVNVVRRRKYEGIEGQLAWSEKIGENECSFLQTKEQDLKEMEA